MPKEPIKPKHEQLSLGLGVIQKKPKEKIKEKQKLIPAIAWLGYNYRITPNKIKRHCLSIIPAIKLLSDDLKAIANQQWMLGANRVSHQEESAYKRELNDDITAFQTKHNSLNPIAKNLFELLYNNKGEPTLFNKIFAAELENRSNNDFTPEEAFLNALYKLDYAYLDKKNPDKLPDELKPVLQRFLKTLSNID